MAGIKDRIIKIIDEEAKAFLNQYYSLYNTKASNNSPQVGEYTALDPETNTGTYKFPDGTTRSGINPGSSPVGPGSKSLIVGKFTIQT